MTLPPASMFEWFGSEDGTEECACTTRFDGGLLVVDAGACPGAGRLSEAPACRRTVVRACRERDADRIATRCGGRERVYLDDDATLLCAAGRFAERVDPHDERLAATALTDPIAAAHEATGRGDAVARIAAETGLALAGEWFDAIDGISPFVGPTIGDVRAAPTPPASAHLLDSQTLSTGATVRRYEPSEGVPMYHLDPPSASLDDDVMSRLDDGRRLIAEGTVTGERAAWRATRQVVDDGARVDLIGRLLQRHTAGHGILTDLFDDPRVTDVFATAPVSDTALKVTVDGELHTTNLRVIPRGVDALAARFRRESGSAFSEASPTLDATTIVGDRRVRVAGTTDPVSDGPAFAFRAHDRSCWTLPRLVDNGTVPSDAAGLLSLTTDLGAATLVAGSRGAGKTTLLCALLWEISPGVRTLVIEDTPELPVAQLQADGREIQSLVTERGDGPGLPADETLRTALRLGEGALVVGEVRGEEAQVLYEAMRIGAGASAVLGTIHGDGGADVRERVVSDLGVPASSFATTDLVVTMKTAEEGDERSRRVAAIEEVVGSTEGPTFEPLYQIEDGRLQSTGRIERGNSVFLARAADTDERYADLRERLTARATEIQQRDRRVAAKNP